MLERYTHPAQERKLAAFETFDRLDTNLDTKTKTADDERVSGSRTRQIVRSLVDGRRLELPTSALRTRRSPN
jgi:hypothetical protein